MKRNGFGIIELMIAVAIIAILGYLAYGNYSSYKIRQNRELATHILMQNAAVMERYYSMHGSYLTESMLWPNILQNIVEQNGLIYEVGIVPTNPGEENQQGFSILAVPLANTIQSDDGNICVDKNGKVYWPVSYSQCSVLGNGDGSGTPGVCSDSGANNQPCNGGCSYGTWTECGGNCNHVLVCRGGYGCGGNCRNSVIYGGCSGHCYNSVIFDGCSGDCYTSTVYGGCTGNCHDSVCCDSSTGKCSACSSNGNGHNK